MRQTADSAAILDQCIERMRRGESMDACLRDHPEQAGELAPMLMAARQLEVLASQHLTDAQRMQGRARIRRTLTSPPQRPPARSWLQGLGLGHSRGLALAGMLSLLLVLVLGSAAVASQPGDLAYPLRVRIERWPAMLATQPGARAGAELATAERRLRELGSYLPGTLQPDLAALDAAVWGVEAAATSATGLAEPQRHQVAEQVNHQARTMAELAAGTADDATRVQLQRAASWSLAVAVRLRAGQGPDGHWPDVDHLLPAPGGPESPAPELPPRPERRTPTPTAPAVEPTRTPAPPGPMRTAPRTSAPTAAPQGPTLAPRPSEPASRPSPGPQPTMRPAQPTPGGPEPGPTSGAGSRPGASATAPPGAGASPQPPEAPTSAPGPPPLPTSPGATSPGPGPEPPGQGPGQSPGPGRPSP